jgi:DNA-binding NarL/FixJ family response regulator
MALWSEGLEVGEVAARLGTTRGSVKYRLKVIHDKLMLPASGRGERTKRCLISTHLFLSGILQPTPAQELTWNYELSRREGEVLLCLAVGMKDTEIMEKLQIRRGTMKTYQLNLRRGLQARNSAHAVRIGLEVELLRVTSKNRRGEEIKPVVWSRRSLNDGWTWSTALP